jgi:hypothetical protein
MVSAVGISVISLRGVSRWDELGILFVEWWQCIGSRYELERLNERDLAEQASTAWTPSTRYRSLSGKLSRSSPSWRVPRRLGLPAGKPATRPFARNKAKPWYLLDFSKESH